MKKIKCQLGTIIMMIIGLTVSIVMNINMIFASILISECIQTPVSKDFQTPSTESNKIVMQNFINYGHQVICTPSILPPINRDLFNASEEYAPKPEWSSSFPDINIVGFAKAGTSHLYRLLTGHSHIEPAAIGNKEFCVENIRVERDAQTQESRIVFLNDEELIPKLYQYRTELHTTRQSMPSTTKLVVNGCIGGSDQVELNYRYIPTTSSKFIVMFRDPADWVWAAWNFWSNSRFDDHDTEDHWTNSTVHYRSPGYFHEIILSMGKLPAFNDLFSRIKFATHDGLRLIELVGLSNILFLPNEDLQPGTIVSRGTLEKLATFLSIDSDDFGQETFQRTNCNSHKGSFGPCPSVSNVGSYEISGKDGMLPKTRVHIYSFFQCACTLWYDKFGIDYPVCRQG